MKFSKQNKNFYFKELNNSIVSVRLIKSSVFFYKKVEKVDNLCYLLNARSLKGGVRDSTQKVGRKLHASG